jgi:glycosyltransferase involved in cell wall biosynthesis
MRIVMVTGIFPPDIGGPATYVPQLAEALTEQGHEITVLTLSDRTDRADNRYPFRVVRLPRQLPKRERWLRTMACLIQLGRSADVLFVNGLALEATLANRVIRKPLVQKVVGDLAWEQATNRGWVRDSFEDFQQKRYGLKVAALKMLRTWWTRQADRVIVPSRYLAHWVAQWGVPAEKLIVIYNALEPLDSITPAAVPLRTPLKAVTVGRLVPWKRVDQLIAAIARCDGAGLVIVGDGPERARLQGMVEALGLANRVYFAGQRSKAETLSLMAPCDLFVLNSTYEGFPHVVLEAMSLGLPVVATAVGGTPEVVREGKNGRLISPVDSSALYTTLSQLLSSAAERQCLAEGVRQTVAQFRFACLVEQTAGLLAATAQEEAAR